MSFYKYFSDHDRVVSSTPLYMGVENISGSDSWQTSSNDPFNFVQFASGTNDFTTGKHVFDLTFGLHSGSLTTSEQKAQYSIYNQFAKMLLGHDTNNNIKQFIALEGISTTVEPAYLPYCFMINLDRSQTKDRIKYGTLDIHMIVSSSEGTTGSIHIKDSGSEGSINYTINAGADGHHYGILRAESEDSGLLQETTSTSSVGYVFYEAGVVILSPYIFAQSGSSTKITGSNLMNNSCGILASGKASYAQELSDIVNDSQSDILEYADFLKGKINSIKYQSVTELNSTIYFCRAYNHEFNYSSNPTYIKDGEIIVKNGDPEEPSRTYITTVGLYSDDNQLLAVAKLSEPILKTRDNELIARVRLDF